MSESKLPVGAIPDSGTGAGFDEVAAGDEIAVAHVVDDDLALAVTIYDAIIAVSGAPVIHIIAVSTDQDVVAFAADQVIVAATTVKYVVSTLPIQVVRSIVPANQQIAILSGGVCIVFTDEEYFLVAGYLNVEQANIVAIAIPRLHDVLIEKQEAGFREALGSMTAPAARRQARNRDLLVQFDFPDYQPNHQTFRRKSLHN